MEKEVGKKSKSKKTTEELPNFTKPVWGDRNMTCDSCNYNDQDIDTFPCAKCHTRH